MLAMRFMLRRENPTPLRTGAALPMAAGPVRPVCWPKATSRRTRGKPTNMLQNSQGMRKAPRLIFNVKPYYVIKMKIAKSVTIMLMLKKKRLTSAILIHQIWKPPEVLKAQSEGKVSKTKVKLALPNPPHSPSCPAPHGFACYPLQL